MTNHSRSLRLVVLTVIGMVGTGLWAQNVYSSPYSITTLAGNSNNAGNLVNGKGTAAAFGNPSSVAVDSAGNVYVADTFDYAVRKITPSGQVTTLAGSGSQGEVDGSGTTAQFGPLYGIAIDSQNNLYVSDWVNSGGGVGGAIRKITPAGVVSTVYSGVLNRPQGLTVDSSFNIYVADAGNSVIRKITSSGSGSVYAGTAGHAGFNDGAVGTGQLGYPTGVAFDQAGNLYVTDSQGDNIREVSSGGVLSTYAGLVAASPGETDGAVANATFTHPLSIASDSSSNLYVSDSGGTVVREITASGTVSTIAGTAGHAVSLDGVGSNAALSGGLSGGPTGEGIAASASGTVYLADSTTSLIRQGAPLSNPAPVVQLQPASETINNGGPLTLTATVSGGNLTYQWYFNGTAIAGATSSSYILNSIGANQAGSYTVVATNSYGSVTSAAAVVHVQTLGQIVNLSTITVAGSGSAALAAGFSLSGSSSISKQLLIRGIGPALSTFGITTYLAAPQLTLYNSSQTLIASDAGWGSSTALSQAFTATGAFALPANSPDSALLSTLPSGTTYSAQVTGVGSAAGTALVEIYDDSLSTAGAQLINISTRANVTPTNPLTAGFVIGGGTSVTVVVRGIGPALTGFGISGALDSTTLTIYQQGVTAPLYTNTGWGNNAALITAFNQVGAFGLTANSGDSALLVTLPPGNYSAQVSSADGTSGIALAEVYELQ